MSHGNSRSVTSKQLGIHRNLRKLVLRHIKSSDLTPIRTHNLRAFEQLERIISQNPGRPCILDSCCGVGHSSIWLANKYPEALVFGIDQSAHRLQKQKHNVPPNCYLLRANCDDIWRLCHRHHIRFCKHFILYPNPWPKPNHLSRRWHGHPTFPLLAALSDLLELRSNWLLYLEEFQTAWRLLGEDSQAIEAIDSVATAITLFEKKYLQSGQTCYRWVSA